jgi:hypothetical protein
MVIIITNIKYIFQLNSNRFYFYINIAQKHFYIKSLIFIYFLFYTLLFALKEDEEDEKKNKIISLFIYFRINKTKYITYFSNMRAIAIKYIKKEEENLSKYNHYNHNNKILFF